MSRGHSVILDNEHTKIELTLRERYDISVVDNVGEVTIYFDVILLDNLGTLIRVRKPGASRDILISKRTIVEVVATDGEE